MELIAQFVSTIAVLVTTFAFFQALSDLICNWIGRDDG